MSLFNDFINAFYGTDSSSAERPCPNCPSDCRIAPGACSVCSPYKEKLVEAIYNVEHMDEIVSKYEVAGEERASSGSTNCPFCGGPNTNPYECEYCGSRLQEGSAKIKVAKASDIPNPILEAQDLIFDRYKAVSGYMSNDDSLTSLLGALFGLSDISSSQQTSLGNKMTESEIKEMAAAYGGSVASYLNGLDNGRYGTLAGRKAYNKQQSSRSYGSGMAGMAGMGGMLFGSQMMGSYGSAAGRSYYTDRPHYEKRIDRPGDQRNYTQRPPQGGTQRTYSQRPPEGGRRHSGPEIGVSGTERPRRMNEGKGNLPRPDAAPYSQSQRGNSPGVSGGSRIAPPHQKRQPSPAKKQPEKEMPDLSGLFGKDAKNTVKKPTKK